MKVADMLSAKSRSAGGVVDVVTIGPEAGVRELVALLAEHNIGAVVVSTDGTTITGIVSERDVVRRLALDGTVVNNTVGAIMTSTVESTTPDALLDDLMQLMTERRIRHIPVLDDDGVLTGIVSIGDVVKHKISQLTFERDQLDSYVRQA